MALFYLVLAVILRSSVSVKLEALSNNIDNNLHDSHNPLERIAVDSTKVVRDEAITLTVNSTQLSKSGEWFEVSWQGVTDPNFDDWIGLYVPALVDPSKTSPAKYSFAVRSPTHISEGRGKLSELAVQWVTINASRPVVKWGTQSGVYDQAASGRSTSYARDDMCGPPATTVGWVDPGTFHAALMTSLQPSQRYYYVYGDEVYGWSDEATFLMAPRPGPEAAVKLLAVADMGQAELDGAMQGDYQMAPSLNTTARMEAEGGEPQLLIHIGDISYARGYVTQWDNFFHQVESLARRMPYMTAIGNHERDWPQTGDRYDAALDSGGECGVAYEMRTGMPQAGRDQPWHSFDFGPIHFLLISTEHDFAPGSAQHDFISSDLSGVDRRVTPWVVMAGHRPMYVSSTYASARNDSDQAVAQALRDALEEMLLTHHVDMVWAGHHHSYQRTCPVYRRTCQGFDGQGVAAAPVHLVIGHAGAGLTGNLEEPTPQYWEVIKLWWGYMRVHATGRSLRCEVVSDEDGGLMDVVQLDKPEEWGAEFMKRQAVLAEFRRRQ